MSKNRTLALCGVLGLAAGVLWWSTRTTEPAVDVSPDPDESGAVVAAHTPLELEFRRPPPTEHWLGDGAETVNKQRRKAWFKELHKAPPDVDVVAVERANGLAQLEKRNALARGELGTPVFAREDGEPYPGPVWAERGSDNQAGRMHVALHSPDHETLYAGSALGSIWKLPLGGGEWSAIGDSRRRRWYPLNPSLSPSLNLLLTIWGSRFRRREVVRNRDACLPQRLRKEKQE